MSMITKPFGNSAASLYTLANKNGMTITLTDIGAAITRIIVLAKDRQKIDVALGYETFEGYKAGKSWYGVTVGRYANRISGGTFTLDGKSYTLEKNEGNNVLHGGPNGYSRRMWKMEMNEGYPSSIAFHLKSPDGDQGMPGNADITVRYALTDDNKIVIRYHAIADKNTVFNLTNHAYFNLNGHDDGSIADHMVWLDCDYFTPIDVEFIPIGKITSVKGTPMDFTTPKTIGRDADVRDYKQIELGNGYDHNYVINAPSLEKSCAHVWSDKTAIELQVYTDLPGIQFYGGNNMGKDSGEKGGGKYQYRGGFCLETQYFPDSPNKPDFPSVVYLSGKAFESTTIYAFDLYGGN